jgi:TonB family protein
MKLILAVISAIPLICTDVSAQDRIGPKPVGQHTCPENIPNFRGMVTTVLSLTVTIDGQTKDVTVAKSSGDTNLDQAAVLCVQQWRWEPARKNGQAIEFKGATYVAWP